MKQFDAFSKPISEFRIKTAFGGYLTILSIIAMIILFYSELKYYLNITRKDEVTVDHLSSNRNINLRMQLEFPKLPCDILGVRIINLQENKEIYLPDGGIEFVKIGSNEINTSNSSGCGPCYEASINNDLGAVNCCNTCKDVFNEYDKKGIKLPHVISFKQCDYDKSKRILKALSSNLNSEGCKIKVNGYIPKVKGKIEISHKRWVKYKEMTDLEIAESHLFNFSYKMNYLDFGEELPGIPNKWKNQEYIQSSRFEKLGYSQDLVFDDAYIDFDMHCIPTQYNTINNKSINSHQFSVRSQYKKVLVSSANGKFIPDTSIPGIHINYDFTPFLVKMTESRRSFLSFVTECCAIIGGIFAFSGMIDIFFFKFLSSVKKYRQKNNTSFIQNY
ncbi:Endoplasmic reticulum vesicle transporter family protein [Cryptosporidium meleagridis]|uniref:Endoplasmic reticulum vesicle transporter family protein n=1 Tax=Cryptosporidium meleagridis TaxID=93969 RepID=A0A2P4Z4E9_9CRYT|nr:Endoplasmic reticulum vesicle transporter family protein [Cryptosporidium meleagridis]